MLERTRIIGAETSREMVFVITSLSPKRRQWEIGNRLPWVRDMSLGEDASRIRRGHSPQILAALRDLVLALLRSEGVRNIAEALRERAADAGKAVRRIHLPLFG